MNNPPRIAFVHEWLTTYGGSEEVLEAMLELWPDAPIFVLVSDPDGQCKQIVKSHRIENSFIARLPNAKKWYRNYLPLMPLAVEQFDLRGYDIVVSNSHAAAKGVITGPDQLHIAHVCSPIRYAWDLQPQYLEETGLTRGVKGLAARTLLHYIRNWDIGTAHRADRMIAISSFVARRIRKIYGRESTVIYPPVDVECFVPGATKGDYYFTASRMVPYKKIGLIAEAFARMPEKKLVIIGDGPEFEKIRSKAGENVRLLGYQPVQVLREHMQKAKALIFAAEEDFGIIPVEAQACGTPVIAYAKGGALETVIDGRTGIFFDEQTAESIASAVQRFEQMRPFEQGALRENAERFSKARFQYEIQEFVDCAWDEHVTNLAVGRQWRQKSWSGIEVRIDGKGARRAYEDRGDRKTGTRFEIDHPLLRRERSAAASGSRREGEPGLRDFGIEAHPADHGAEADEVLVPGYQADDDYGG